MVARLQDTHGVAEQNDPVEGHRHARRRVACTI